MNSIRRRLLAALLGALLLAGLAGAVATYLSARGEVDRLLDEELRQVALSLRDHAQLDFARLERGTNDPDLRVLVQIWDPAFDRPYSSRVASPLPRQTTEGYTTVAHEGRSWRIYTARSSTQTIQVAQPTLLRTELAALT
ncbi:MAG: ATP-binding protein, partial [Burkholderiaceae bacterium]